MPKTTAYVNVPVAIVEVTLYQSSVIGPGHDDHAQPAADIVGNTPPDGRPAGDGKPTALSDVIVDTRFVPVDAVTHCKM